MTLSIYNNLMVANIARNLNRHYSLLSDSVQKLSSGLRVNSAADDAAGLAVREMMRAESTSCRQGMRNANDAVSMIQTADGALSVIDEKLIRMKELAQQAATGTYDSSRRLLIDNEFQAMGAEIDRIARAADFNGIKLLDGSLSGTHDGSGLTSTGAVKIHFGPGNDSAEDYYYVRIGDCTLKGLGLDGGDAAVTLNDYDDAGEVEVLMDPNTLGTMDELFVRGAWHVGLDAMGRGNDNFMFVIPKGTKNVVINLNGTGKTIPYVQGDNDIALFTRTGIHLAGTPLSDYVYTSPNTQPVTNIDANSHLLGFSSADYDGSRLNTGPGTYDPTGNTLAYSTYNGMTIGYSGDPDQHDAVPNDGSGQNWADYEILTIDEVTEDLIVALPGLASASLKVYWNSSSGTVSINTQDLAQKALERIDAAIVQKDKVRAHLGALQNRFENTVTNLAVQAENLQAAESRISDMDAATEMTEFVRTRILAQAATAMLSQANSMSHMLAGLLEG